MDGVWTCKECFQRYRAGTVLLLPVPLHFEYSSEALHTHQSISKFLLYCTVGLLYYNYNIG